MEQEPSDELCSLQSHCFIPVSISIITPEKNDLTTLHFDDAMIADCNLVDVSSQIVKEPLRAIQGRPRVDDPFPAIKVLQKSRELHTVDEGLYLPPGDGLRKYV